MQANELRIGNYVFDDLGMISKVQEITDKGILTVGTIRHTHLTEPIPLTEQWLIDFGFEENELFLKRHKYDMTRLYYNPNELLIRMRVVSRDSITINFEHIKHVHQLQNLYFCLTGNELSIQTNL